ncbi:hypothetical protein FKW77_001944 [Venturia effusa]|uniref:Carbohydrate esterase n=1 Tax=Venturia effusa TaxID=50376 RepID=A0A517LNF8_9PEZI|nr:hypothetical protein FKW77_001944 [Venturia effusa]
MLTAELFARLLLMQVGLVAAQPAGTSKSESCGSLHTIVVRASMEYPGYGMMGALAQAVLESVNGSTSEAIDYPALLQPYDESSYAGIVATTKQLQSHVDRCPDAKVILMGYSQGAHIIGDVMCGGGGKFGLTVDPNNDIPIPSLGPPTPPVAAKYQKSVVAMIQMGDPRFLPKKSYDVGTATHEGFFPRPANISCDAFAPIIQSYCDEGDVYCDQGDVYGVHTSYVGQYGDAALDFIKSRLQKIE